MTERLYYRDSFSTAFDARVVSRDASGCRIILDRTLFYPTSGGQQHDTGHLNGVPVIDVIDDGDTITHLLSAPSAAERATGEIDWTRRFDHMQQHTGQHILSAVFEDLFGFSTASVHFGDESSSIDLTTRNLTRDEILKVESRVNEIVMESRPVTVSFENAATVAGLRKPPPREGEIRIVSVENVDRSACGGTHVRSTSEIGPMLLRKLDRMHGNARIEFLCGARALRQSRSDYEILSAAAAALGTAPHEVPARSTMLSESLRDAERMRKKLDIEVAAFRAAAAYSEAQQNSLGARFILERSEAGALDEFRPMAHALTGFSRVTYLGVALNSAQLLLATSEDSGLDAGKLLKAALTAVAGKGGGSARVAQGTAPADALENVVAELTAQLG